MLLKPTSKSWLKSCRSLFFCQFLFTWSFKMKERLGFQTALASFSRASRHLGTLLTFFENLHCMTTSDKKTWFDCLRYVNLLFLSGTSSSSNWRHVIDLSTLSSVLLNIVQTSRSKSNFYWNMYCSPVR